MDDRELTTILRTCDEPAALPDSAAADIQARMHSELDRTLANEAEVVALFPTSAPSRSPRRWTWAAAALIVLVGVSALVLDRRDSAVVPEPVSTRPPTASVASTVPTEQPLLTACLEFIESTTFDGTVWREHFLPSGPGDAAPTPDDFEQLAAAIDMLIATAPDVDVAAVSLQAAAAEARGGEPDAAEIVRQLDLAQDTLVSELMLPCLVEDAMP